MNDRLLTFIKSRFARQCDFAEAMGWDRQYLCKLTKGVVLGITPVVAILEKFPELDARWLLLGEGRMLRTWHDDCRGEIAEARESLSRALALLDACPQPSPASVLEA